VRAGHERRHLFVAYLNEIDGAIQPVEGSHDAVDSVSGVAVDPRDAPLEEALQKKVGRRVLHAVDPAKMLVIIRVRMLRPYEDTECTHAYQRRSNMTARII